MYQICLFGLTLLTLVVFLNRVGYSRGGFMCEGKPNRRTKADGGSAWWWSWRLTAPWSSSAHATAPTERFTADERWGWAVTLLRSQILARCKNHNGKKKMKLQLSYCPNTFLSTFLRATAWALCNVKNFDSWERKYILPYNFPLFWLRASAIQGKIRLLLLKDPFGKLGNFLKYWLEDRHWLDDFAVCWGFKKKKAPQLSNIQLLPTRTIGLNQSSGLLSLRQINLQAQRFSAS